jgi:hypothetical protein
MGGHSTVQQLIEIYHNICLSLENREDIRDWLYFTLLRIFHIFPFEINITVLKMTSKSSPHRALT